MKWNYLAIMCVAIIFCISITCVNAIETDHCAILGFDGEIYTLITNVSTNETFCFTITAPDVTLDCGEYSIKINNNEYTSENNTGVYSDKPNTVLKNCDKSKQNKTKVALFDIIAEIISTPKSSSEDLVVKVSLINFGGSDSIDANLKYTILNTDGSTVLTYTKIVPVKTQTEFLEHINTSGLIEGKYTLNIKLTYDGQKYPASTEKIFYINAGAIQGLLRNISLKKTILPAITLILLLGVYRKSRMIRITKLRETTHDSCIEQLNNIERLNNIEKNFK
jgi:hypothetical protein